MEGLVGLVVGLGEGFRVGRQPLFRDIDLQCMRLAPRATALYFDRRRRSSPSPVPGLGHSVTIAGVSADAARARGGVACASPGTAGAGGAPG